MSGLDEVVRFYDDFAPDYELAYAGRWEEAVDRHGAAISSATSS